MIHKIPKTEIKRVTLIQDVFFSGRWLFLLLTAQSYERLTKSWLSSLSHSVIASLLKR